MFVIMNGLCDQARMDNLLVFTKQIMMTIMMSSPIFENLGLTFVYFYI